MKNTTYKLWDNREKTYLEGEYQELGPAETAKDEYLDAGNYPDQPHTVISIHVFEDDKFVGEA